MARIRDLTGDLGKLRNRSALPRGTPPRLPSGEQVERQPAFDPAGLFFWLMIAFFLALQSGFLFWLAA